MEKITETFIQPNLNNTATWKTETKHEIICDICEQNACVIEKDFNGDEFIVKEFLTIKDSWGYFSPWDGENWESHVCIQCVKDKIMPLMKINWKSYFGDSSNGYYKDGKEFWRANNKEEFEEMPKHDPET